MTGARLHLTFPEHLIREPVIYSLGQRFSLVTNIRRANVEEGHGWVILEMEGTEENLADGLAGLGLRQRRLAGADQFVDVEHRRIIAPGRLLDTRLERRQALAREIVEGGGGRIWIESARGAGTTIHFTWPCPEA